MKGARRHANRMICETLDALRVLLAPRTRLLGLDVGAKTIGLALSDVTRMVATPMDLIRRKKLTSDLETLRRLVAEHGVGGLVIGLPIAMDGRERSRAQSVRQFARDLARSRNRARSRAITLKSFPRMCGASARRVFSKQGL